MCQAYRRQYGFDAISAMPTNLYGPGDNYHPENSHVLPALIRRFHEAKVKGAECVTIWGTGTPMREFLHVDDMAEACVFLLKNTSAAEHINVVCGEDISIMEAARLVARVVGYSGKIETDPQKSDGTPASCWIAAGSSAWAGSRASALRQASGIPTAIFCVWRNKAGQPYAPQQAARVHRMSRETFFFSAPASVHAGFNMREDA